MSGLKNTDVINVNVSVMWKTQVIDVDIMWKTLMFINVEGQL
jgi:hypothetical protein